MWITNSYHKLDICRSGILVFNEKSTLFNTSTGRLGELKLVVQEVKVNLSGKYKCRVATFMKEQEDTKTLLIYGKLIYAISIESTKV